MGGVQYELTVGTPSSLIPPCGGHPCLWLTLPSTERVVDFHHQVIAHAGRTIKNPLESIDSQRVFGFMPLFVIWFLVSNTISSKFNAESLPIGQQSVMNFYS